MNRPSPAPLSLASLAFVSCVGGATPVHLPDASAASLAFPGAEGAENEASRPPSQIIEKASSQPSPRAVTLPSPTLDGFFAKARELGSGSRSEHLRIGVFGDSHIQADYWTGAVRRALQAELGDGGPGFVHVGWPGYRHEGIRLQRSGPFHTEPQPMTAGERKGDGIYGLLGVRVVFEAEGQAQLRVVDGPAREMRFDISYRLPSCPSRARVVIEEGPARKRQAETRVLACTEADEAGPIQHLELTTTGEAPSLDIEVQEGLLEIFGVVVETRTPGVVVDSLGIAGARADTPLAWDPEAFANEVHRRSYDLVVLAYGTNDSVPESPAAVPAFGRHLTTLLTRLRTGAEGADCLVIGPMDRGPLKRRKTAPEERIVELNEEASRVAEARNCAFFSALEAMGGPGTMREWGALTPPLAQRDLVHLSRAGYERLGELLTEVLRAPGRF